MLAEPGCHYGEQRCNFSRLRWTNTVQQRKAHSDRLYFSRYLSINICPDWPSYWSWGSACDVPSCDVKLWFMRGYSPDYFLAGSSDFLFCLAFSFYALLVEADINVWFWSFAFSKMSNFSLKYVSASLGTYGGHFLLFTDDIVPCCINLNKCLITTKSLNHVWTAVVILISAESATRIIPQTLLRYRVCAKTQTKLPLCLSSFFFSVHDQTHLHGWLMLVNAQINPLPRQALVRHGGWNLILDISVMTFYVRSWEECDWQSGDNWSISRCESCRPCKHKNVNVTWKALLAAGCISFSSSCPHSPLWFCL